MEEVLGNNAPNETRLRQSGTERNVNMDGSAAGVSNAGGPRYANMDGSTASVSNGEGPRSVNMGVSTADVKRRFIDTGTNEEGNPLIAYQPYWVCHIYIGRPNNKWIQCGLRPYGQSAHSINEGKNLQVLHVALHRKGPHTWPELHMANIPVRRGGSWGSGPHAQSWGKVVVGEMRSGAKLLEGNEVAREIQRVLRYLTRYFVQGGGMV